MKLLQALAWIIGGISVAACAPFIAVAAGPLLGFVVYVVGLGAGLCMVGEGLERW